jgi:hypothetical protein
VLELAREDVKGQEQVAQVESLAPVASGAFADRVEVRLTLRECNLVKRDRDRHPGKVTSRGEQSTQTRVPLGPRDVESRCFGSEEAVVDHEIIT